MDYPREQLLQFIEAPHNFVLERAHLREKKKEEESFDRAV